MERPSNYRPEIDGLRALAVLPVILFHAGFPAFSGGFVGVDVFFVISGFLITGIILNDLDKGRFSLLTFYERRARRILPALVLVVTLCIPFTWLWFTPLDMRDFGQSVTAVAVFASNILFWREAGYFFGASELKPLLHTWSLAVEEQYYVLVPLLLMVVWRLGRARAVMAAVAVLMVLSFALAEWASVHRRDAAFYLLPMRAWELMIGAAAALYLFRRDGKTPAPRRLAEPLAVLGLGLIAVAVILYDSSTPFPGMYALAPTVGTVLLILFARPGTMSHRLLASRVLVSVGLISYSAYLWHQPLFAFARYRELDGEPSDVLMLALCVVTLPLAYASWRWVEQPCRDRTKLSRRTVFLVAPAVLAAFAGFGVFVHLDGGVMGRKPPAPLAAEAYADLVRGAGRDRGVEGRECESAGASVCMRHRGEGEGGILLLGDSHSADFGRALRSYARAHDVTAWQISVGGCRFIPVEADRNEGGCGAARDRLFAFLAEGRVSQALVSFNLDRQMQALTADQMAERVTQLRAFFQTLKDAVPDVTWFTARPVLNHHPVRAAFVGKACEVALAARPEAVSAMLDRVNDDARALGMQVFDQDAFIRRLLQDQPCHGGAIEGRPVYEDEDHLTVFGADLVFKDFLKTGGADATP